MFNVVYHIKAKNIWYYRYITIYPNCLGPDEGRFSGFSEFLNDLLGQLLGWTQEKFCTVLTMYTSTTKKL